MSRPAADILCTSTGAFCSLSTYCRPSYAPDPVELVTSYFPHSDSTDPDVDLPSFQPLLLCHAHTRPLELPAVASRAFSRRRLAHAGTNDVPEPGAVVLLLQQRLPAFIQAVFSVFYLSYPCLAVQRRVLVLVIEAPACRLTVAGRRRSILHMDDS